MERQQNAGSLTLINRFVSYFAEPPNILLLVEFPKDAVDRLVTSAEKSIKANDTDTFLALFDWNGASDKTREFVKSEFDMLTTSTIHSIKVTPRNFRGELVHWSAYQHYQPNMEIVGYLDIDFTRGAQRRKTLSLEVGKSGNEMQLVNYVPKGERELPKGQIEGLSIHGQIERLADGSLLESFIITNPGTLVSGHVANEEIRQQNIVQKEVVISPGKLNGRITVASQQSGDQNSRSSKQSFKLIDGETGNPLQGLKCQAIIAKLNESPRYQACTTDEHGVVEVVIVDGESAAIAEVPRGWFSVGVGSIYAVQVPESDGELPFLVSNRNNSIGLFGSNRRGRGRSRYTTSGEMCTAGNSIRRQQSKQRPHIEIGAGITVTGKLSFPEHVAKNKLKVYARAWPILE